ncbi:hypothetical protein K0M31_003131 [Melipona bicolor]|uniref:Uncharacterized protein n=1 Tax=Melipona bicolor TaxID=60889 RepID=A0AA40G0A8_9HYME|nr:hypothetical protein K0M31_003131 [Melipona bicolor]
MGIIEGSAEGERKGRSRDLKHFLGDWNPPPPLNPRKVCKIEHHVAVTYSTADTSANYRFATEAVASTAVRELSKLLTGELGIIRGRIVAHSRTSELLSLTCKQREDGFC